MKKRIYDYFVHKGGLPCRVDRGLIKNRGALVPCDPGEEPTNFGETHSLGGRRAHRAITRTVALQRIVAQSVIADSDRMAPLLADGDFEVVKKLRK